MKKKKALAILTIVALLSTISFFAIPTFSEAQEVEGPKNIQKRYRSLDDNAKFYCHCRVKGTKCACVVN
ncbi:MAG: hypothetical protein HEP71_12490 [Roseivirga sp.]|nr:hypothetical protein [Roseivirga sp.]